MISEYVAIWNLESALMRCVGGIKDWSTLDVVYFVAENDKTFFVSFMRYMNSFLLIYVIKLDCWIFLFLLFTIMIFAWKTRSALFVETEILPWDTVK